MKVGSDTPWTADRPPGAGRERPGYQATGRGARAAGEDANWRVALRLAKAAAYGGGAATAATVLFVGLLKGQARLARRSIPMAQAPPPRCDGLYGAKFPGEPLNLVVLGDSTAAGYGASRPRETPGALLATGISRRLSRPVRLHRLAVVGAISAGLDPQTEAALERKPDLAIIFVGANDVTRRTPNAVAVRHLVNAVRRLRAAGAGVVVGTCPDLGTIQPIQPPLRWMARRWSRQLAAAQTVAVVEAGGWTVSLGDLLGPRFAADPYRMFSSDRFHPSAEGYAAAAVAVLPTALGALSRAGLALPEGVVDEQRLAVSEGVRSLPQAAVEAANVAGTEVSAARVGGRDRGPGGRWALLRIRRPLFGLRRAIEVEAVPNGGPESEPVDAAQGQPGPAQGAPPAAYGETEATDGNQPDGVDAADTRPGTVVPSLWSSPHDGPPPSTVESR
jgi:lysophospholipase L1-like esterase